MLSGMDLTVSMERELDGRWVAGVEELSGVWAYGVSPEEAVMRVQSLALRVLADRVEHGEATEPIDQVSFKLPHSVA